MSAAGRARFALAALCLGLSAQGCSSDPDPLTQIRVTVDSDLDVPDEIDRIAIEVSGMVTDEAANADLKKKGLPRSLTLVHQGGRLGPVTVTATARLGRTVVVERTVRTSFVKGKLRELAIELQRACVDIDCPGGASCDDGVCVSIADGEPVETADGAVDGGEDDAGADAGDAGAMDAGDAGGDAGDAGGDAGDAGGDAGDAGGGDAGTDSGPAVNEPPACTITAPADGATLTAGLAAQLNGECTDPEDGAVTSGLHWSSDLDGPLGTGATQNVTLGTTGDQIISLCAPDPADASMEGCATITVHVDLPVAPTASITSVTQSNSSVQPFSIGPAVSLMGTVTGQQLAVTWTDSLVGWLGNATSVSMIGPQGGRHTVLLNVSDNVGQRASDSTTFVVLGNGQSQLVQAFTTVNTTIGLAGGTRIDALARDSSDHGLLANPLPQIFTMSGIAQPATAGPTAALSPPTLPGHVHSMLVAESANLIYIATDSGLTVCGYAASTGIDSGACTTYKDGDLPDNDVSSVARIRDSGEDYVVVGTKAGLVASTDLDSNGAQSALDNHDVAGLAVGEGAVWVATRDNGLYDYDPSNNEAHHHDGGPSSALAAIVIDAQGMVWVGSQSGLGRYDPVRRTWLVLHPGDLPAPGLASDDVRCLASTRVTLGGTPHDVLWIGTDLGVSRLDAGIPSFMTLTSADGLPSNSVRSIVVLANGYKLIGTDLGLARYTGP